MREKSLALPAADHHQLKGKKSKNEKRENSAKLQTAITWKSNYEGTSIKQKPVANDADGSNDK